MILKDLEFIIDPYQSVQIVEYYKKNMLVFNAYDQQSWYSVNGLNREIINISAADFYLIIEVYE